MGRSRDAVHSEIYKGFRIEIFSDDDAESPREWDNVGTMTCFHRRYNLGDKHNFGSVRSFMESLVSESRLQRTDEQKDDIDIDELDDGEVMELALMDNIILPLYLYDHSGITMKTTPFSCKWDSGQVGWIHCSKKRGIEECGSEEKAKELLVSEVETYDNFLTGNVYGFVVSKNISGPDIDDADDIEWEEVDSCWGYNCDYLGKGWEDHLLADARASADGEEKAQLPLLASGGVLKPDEATK